KGLARFGSSELAQQIFQDVKDGVLRNLSVGYLITEAIEDLGSVIRFAWQPLEVSVVGVPADPQAGFFRSLKGYEMNMNVTENNQTSELLSRSQRRGANRSEVETRDAVREINAMAAQFKIPNHKVESYIDERGLDADGFRAFVMTQIRDTGRLRPSEEPELGLSGREIERYSFARAIAAMMDPLAKRDAGFEIECSRAYAQQINREPQGLWVPRDVLMHGQRDLLVGTPSAGGYLRPTDHYAAGFIDLLRKRCHVFNLGATHLTDLNGNVLVPSQTGSSTAYWVSENGAVTESQPAFGQVNLTPKTVGGYVDYSRKMLLQSSPEIEMLVRTDLAASIAVEIDRVAIAGSGSGPEPLGILNTSGIGSVAIGTNGGAPTWEHILALEELLALANADTLSLAYLTNPKVRRKLKSLSKVSGDVGAGFIWEALAADEPGWGRVNGYRSASTGNVPSNLTKGTSSGICSAMILGNWADLLIGQWGGLDIIVDPYSGATAGTQRVVALQDVDIAIRRVASFAAIADILTT
ncbi:MAG: phage major capsid protein, partial [Anaerolineales bacterium]|nr:phage major capsid protein [Anaerolineales bacterium]